MEDTTQRLPPHGVLPSLLSPTIYWEKGSGFHITTLPGQALKMTYKRKDRKIPSCKLAGRAAVGGSAWVG